MKTLCFLLLAILSFSACEKVINVDIKDAPRRLVIAGVITDVAGDALVQLSQTNRVSEATVFNGVPGASVSIRDEAGSSWLLEETAPGIYTNPSVKGTPGQTYHLQVSVDGEEITAASTMPLKVPLDSVFVTSEFLVTESINVLNVQYQDPAGVQNNYLFEYFKNGAQQDISYIFDDDYTDGRPNIQKLYYFPEEDSNKIVKGDTLLVNMFNIDRPTLKYWFSVFRSANGQSGQASPANPVSNLVGNALGYFSAQTRETRAIVAP